jgi:hypothetical protein
VILVAADAFDEHLDVRARNHHLLHLGQLWQVAWDDSWIHIVLGGHQAGRYGPFPVVCIP